MWKMVCLSIYPISIVGVSRTLVKVSYPHPRVYYTGRVQMIARRDELGTVLPESGVLVLLLFLALR